MKNHVLNCSDNELMLIKDALKAFASQLDCDEECKDEKELVQTLLDKCEELLEN